MSCLKSVANDIIMVTTSPPDKNTYNFTFKILVWEIYDINDSVEVSFSTSCTLLQMILDVFGLMIITLCTSVEAIEDWNSEFSEHFVGNEAAMFFWILGALLAVFGLIAIMFNCAAMERLKYLEHTGMAMLTLAPVVNSVAWCLLETGDLLDNYTLIATEIVEFIGMNILNYSYWNKKYPWSECFIEMTGYSVLSCAAILDLFIYPEKITEPVISIRTSSANIMDVLGLIALMVVAIGKYQMHVDGVEEYASNYSDSNEQHVDKAVLDLLPCSVAGPVSEIVHRKRPVPHVGKDYTD